MHIGSIALLAAVAALGGTANAIQPADRDTTDVGQSSPGVDGLVAQIADFFEADLSVDPQDKLDAILALDVRVRANGRVPTYQQGRLAQARATAHFYLRQFDAAREQLEEAARFYEAGDTPPAEMGELYISQGSTLGSMGIYDEAIAGYRRGYDVFRGIEGAAGPKMSQAEFGIAYVYFRQGRIEESIPHFRSSVDMMLKAAGPSNHQAISRLSSFSVVLGRSGREGEALETARRAATLAREHLATDHPTYALAINNLGSELVRNRLYAEAVPVLREALELRRTTIGPDASRTAISMRNLAAALKPLGHLDESEALVERAAAIFEATEEVESPFTLANLWSELAENASRRGDWDRFELYSAKALARADAAVEGDNVEQARLHLYHAEGLLLRGEASRARSEAERWVPILERDLIEGHRERIWGRLFLARLRQLDGTGGAALLPVADEAIADLERRLGDASVRDAELVREADEHREAALLYLAIATDLEDEERIFRAMQLAGITELSRGQQFARGNPADEKAAVALRDRLIELGRERGELRARIDAAEDPDLVRDLGADLARADRALTETKTRLARDFPAFVERYRPVPTALATIQRRLEPTDLLLAPVEGATQAYSVRVTANAVRSTPMSAAMVKRATGALRDAVEEGAGADFPLASAHELFSALFPEGLGETRRLLVHGGDRMASLPLAMLTTAPHDGSLRSAPWLARVASTQVVGNLAFFGLPASQGSGRRFVGVGGSDLPDSTGNPGLRFAPLFRGGQPDRSAIEALPPLPAAASELAAMARSFKAANRTLLVGPSAAEERFKATPLDDVSVLAFATHGLVAGEIAGLWEPALLLGTLEGSGEDGLLGASEIARLDLDADWVILSACNTAAGGAVGKPAYAGLASAFVGAGARAMLLSHWRVRDDAAAYLTVRTVERAAKGTSRAEALRQAQLRLIDERKVTGSAHPSVWAPFVLIEN